jgi:hypothetical protein
MESRAEEYRRNAEEAEKSAEAARDLRAKSMWRTAAEARSF